MRSALVVEALVLRGVLPLLLRATPLDRLLSRLARARGGAPLESVSAALDVSERCASFARVVPDTCLYRALTRFALLARHGHPASFVLAVVEAEVDVTGHAWVELDGTVFGEELDRPYVVTLRYPAQGVSDTRSSNGPTAEPTVSATTK